MKKFFLLTMAAAAMLLTSSCAKDATHGIGVVGNEVEVCFTADLGEINSRAIADGLTVNEVAWGIYQKNDDGSRTFLPNLQGVLPLSNKEGKLNIRLASGKTYDVALFAYYAEQPTTAQAVVDPSNNPLYYTINLAEQKVAVKYEKGNTVANDELRDCFWVVEENIFIEGPLYKTFTLTRPLAQLNLGVTKEDVVAAKNAGLEILQSAIIVPSYTEFNMFTGEVGGDLKDNVIFAKSNIPDMETEELVIDDPKLGNYEYLATTYLLVNDKITLDVLVGLYDDANADAPVNILSYSYVPFQRNYRTNIIGALLTNPAEFNIVVDNDFNKPDYIVNHWAGDLEEVIQNSAGVYEITNASQLAWIAYQVNTGKDTFEGKTVKQMNHVDLNGTAWVPIGNAKYGFGGTYDGNGQEITNLYVNTPEYAGLFGKLFPNGTVKNLKVSKADVQAAHYAGVIAGYVYGNIVGCTVEDARVLAIPLNATRTVAADNGDKAGGIAGYLGEGDYTIKNNKVVNAIIIAYRDLGGIAGAAYLGGKDFTNNTIEKSYMRADQNYDGLTYVDPYLGYIVGRVLDGEIDQSNTATEMEEEYAPEVLNPENTSIAFVDKNWNNNAPVEGGELKCQIKLTGIGTLTYNVTEGKDWATINIIDTDDPSIKDVVITVAPNETGEARECNMFLHYGTDDIGVNISQDGPTSITVYPESLKFGAEGGEQEFVITVVGGEEGEQLNVETDEWYSVLIDDALVATVNVDPNTSSEARTGSIKLTWAGLEATVTITQEGGGNVVTTLPALETDKFYKFQLADEVEAGNWYAIIAENQAAKALTGNYGYLNVEDATINNGVVSLLASCAFGLLPTDGGYTIQQYDGKYLYQTGTYDSFNVSEALPETGYVWAVESEATTSAVTITNVTKEKYVQYRSQYTSYGCYEDDLGTKPSLYKLVEVDNTPRIITVATEQAVFAADGGAIEYEVVTYGEATLSVESAPDWVTTAINDNVITVTAPENTGEERTGTMVVKYGDAVSEVTLKQYAKSAAGTQTETYDFSQISDFSDWTNSYIEHIVEYDNVTVTFSKANRQSTTITDIPVTKGQDIYVVMKNNAILSSAAFEFKQWGTKAQTINIYTSTDGGKTYSTDAVATSSDFSIDETTLPAGTNALKIKFSSSSNQIGAESMTLSYEIK